MEIVNANCATLCNFEVMRHLQKIKDSKDSRNKNKGQLATITYETIKYLEATPCGQQTSESVSRCLKALAPFNLNKNEKLILVNTPPTTALEIQLIVEEMDTRLTEEQTEQILGIVAQHFPHVQNKQEEADPE